MADFRPTIVELLGLTLVLGLLGVGLRQQVEGAVVGKLVFIVVRHQIRRHVHTHVLTGGR